MRLIDGLVQFLSEPSIIIGLVAMVGLLVQRKPLQAVLGGAARCALSMVILFAGARIVSTSVLPLGPLLQAAFRLRGVFPVNEVIFVLTTGRLAQAISLTLPLALLVNIIVARFTPWKYIFLSSHLLIYFATLTVGVLSVSHLAGWHLTVASGLTVGVYCVAAPAVTAKFVRRVTGSGDFVIGHSGSSAYVIAGIVGRWVGDPGQSAEDLPLPAWAGFLNEPMAAIGLVMLLLYEGAVLLAPHAALAPYLSGAQPAALWALIQVLTFVAGIRIAIFGVGGLLESLVPAFRGIAERLVAGARPALDATVLLPYGPKSLLFGYLASMVGGLLALTIQMLLHLPVILPNIPVHFYVGGISGIIGNAAGGWRGALAGGFLHGLIFTFLSGGMAQVLPAMDPSLAGTGVAEPDFHVLGLVLYWLGHRR